MAIIILLHGGGLSLWSFKDIISLLQNNYHIVTPIIDGHGEDWQETFVSTEDSARKLIEYVDKYYNGKVFALGGLSIGAEIIIEVLSIKTDISENVIIESALVYHIKGTKLLILN